MTDLRGYQKIFKGNIYDAWDNQGHSNVLGVLPTGGGKTATFSDIMLNRDVPSCAIAHRQELVGQISTALARNGVRHRVIGPPKIIKMCVNLHMEEMGRSYFDPGSWHAVAGVDTLIRRTKELAAWTPSVKLWVEDEAHHVLKSNKWGKSVEMFPNAIGLGVTATPTRADGRGLGEHADGVFDVMVDGPSMRELIELGYLTDYDVYAPESDYHRPEIVGASGDYTRDGMRAAAKKSKIVGDVVKSYLQFARGKLGVTFVPDLETAAEMAAQFNASGVPAAVVSSETSDEDRIRLLREFKHRKLLQLVNVDLFGEGFDLPAIEVVSFARPTASLSLFIQQFGRVLRLFIDPNILKNWESFHPAQRKQFIAASTKPVGIVIDHVGNVTHHRLPDAKRDWSLDRRNSRGDSDRTGIIPVWTCHVCSRTQERIYDPCKFCGHPKLLPAVRSGPSFVDGDLVKIDPAILAQMREEIAAVDMDAEVFRQDLIRKHCPTIGQQAHVNRHVMKQAAQKDLRESLAWWGGLQRSLGRSDSESYRRFYFEFGTDVMTAQTLGSVDAYMLKSKVDDILKGIIKN